MTTVDTQVAQLMGFVDNYVTASEEYEKLASLGCNPGTVAASKRATLESALRAALAQAEQDAFERSAKVCEQWRDKAVRKKAEDADSFGPTWIGTIAACHSCAAAIRSLAKGTK